MINNKIFQAVFDEVSVFLPTNWEKTVIQLEYGEASYTFSFYVRMNGKYTKCFDLPLVDEDALMRAFRRIDCQVSRERKQENGDLWTVMTMIVENSGKMHTDFDYEDHSENAYQYSKDWKKKYLV